MSATPAFSCQRCYRAATGDESDNRTICSRCRRILRVDIPFAHPHGWTAAHCGRQAAPAGPLLRRSTRTGRVLGISWDPDYWTSPRQRKRGAAPWPADLVIGAVKLQCPNGNLHDPLPGGYGATSGPAFRDGESVMYDIHPLLHDEARRRDRSWSVAFRSVADAAAAADTWARDFAGGWADEPEQLGLF